MSIIVDGVTIQDCAGVNCDATNIKLVSADGIIVYTEVCYTPGEKIFYEDNIWVCPNYVTNVRLCMIGGGGSGASPESIVTQSGGGGYSGAIVDDDTVAVTPGNSYNIVCGLGGTGITGIGMNGKAGAQSSFGSTIAAGGAGGVNAFGSEAPYAGNGASRTTCFGTFHDGTRSTGQTTVNGGQAGFGNGGAGGGGNGGYGAGGGANYQYQLTGAGGRGMVHIEW